MWNVKKKKKKNVFFKIIQERRVENNTILLYFIIFYYSFILFNISTCSTVKITFNNTLVENLYYSLRDFTMT